MTFSISYQQGKFDCGLASLKMITDYWGIDYPSRFIKKINMRMGGMSLFTLGKCAQEVGLHSLALKCTIEELYEKIPLPVIILWNMHHYIVVYRMTQYKIWVADPAIGLLTYTDNEFIKGWYEDGHDRGILLTFEKFDDNEQQI